MLIVITIIKLIVILCIVATIHELGHFLAAKFFKMNVDEFSIGFGPKIYQKKYKNTKYSLRWIPLGGYCLIEGEEKDVDSQGSFSKKPPIQRIAVLAMGVIFNIVLAFVVLMGISFSDKTLTTEITEFTNDSILYQAGLQTGDTITKINGEKVILGQDLKNTKFTNSDITNITYLSGGVEKEIVVNNAVKDIGYIGVAFLVQDEIVTTEITDVRPNNAAEKAGLKAKDKIIKVNDYIVNNASEIIKIVKENPEKEVKLTVLRYNSDTIDLTIIPSKTKEFDLGIYDVKLVDTNVYYAFNKSIAVVKTITSSYVEIFKGNVNIKDVSSIVGIGDAVSRTKGLFEYLNMLAIISLAIGTANLLPFLPLDGGKIILVFIEWITRKKVSEKIEGTLSMIGFSLLILLTIVVTFNDIVRIF